jgi:hypothetical protein
MPWLTIRWNSLIPSASIFLVQTPLISRATRNLYSSEM